MERWKLESEYYILDFSLESWFETSKDGDWVPGGGPYYSSTSGRKSLLGRLKNYTLMPKKQNWNINLPASTLKLEGDSAGSSVWRLEVCILHCRVDTWNVRG